MLRVYRINNESIYAFLRHYGFSSVQDDLSVLTYYIKKYIRSSESCFADILCWYTHPLVSFYSLTGEFSLMIYGLEHAKLQYRWFYTSKYVNTTRNKSLK